GGRVALVLDSAPDRERNEQLARHSANGRGQRATLLDRRGDVENHELGYGFFVVPSSQRCRLSGRSQALELYALHDLSVAHVEAGDDAPRQHVSLAPR